MRASLNLVQPERASRLIDAYVPQYLEFFRPVISISETERAESSSPQITSSLAASLAAADLAEALAPPSKSQPSAIYGSVSTADIVANIKALMTSGGDSAEAEEAARVVLSSEDITIEREEGAQVGEELDRIKTLGDFIINIQVKGGEVVRRVVRVNAHE